MSSRENLRIVSSKQFVADFQPPDYLIDGVAQRRFIYSMTARTGEGKTAVALLIAASVAKGKPLGDCQLFADTRKVLYFAGENPDDIRMRWIAMGKRMKFDVNGISVYFVPGSGSISSDLERIARKVEALGGVDLVIVDTSAAYFEGENENDNVGAGKHWRMLRKLTELPGEPCVIVPCHPTKSAGDDNLLPRGGGAAVAEVDGNLTCTLKWPHVKLHWQGKHRGPSFEPLMFRLDTEKDAVTDSRQRPIPVVVAHALTGIEYGEQAGEARDDDAKVVATMRDNENRSIAGIANTLNWQYSNGGPDRSRVQRALKRLERSGRVTNTGNGHELRRNSGDTTNGARRGKANGAVLSREKDTVRDTGRAKR